MWKFFSSFILIVVIEFLKFGVFVDNEEGGYSES